MKRIVAAVAVIAFLFALPTGCGSEAEPLPDETPVAAPATPVSLEGFDAMPEDGAGERAAAEAAIAAIDALPAAKFTAEDREALKADRRLIAYLVRVELDGQGALFEVRADGIAHNIYGYGRAFDSGSIIWQPVDDMEGERVEPRSEGEVSAVAAVDEMMRDAFPDGGFTLGAGGYRFAFIADGLDPVLVEVAADGSTILSVSA